MKNLSIEWSEKPAMENFKRQFAGMINALIERIKKGVKVENIELMVSPQFHSIMLDLDLPPARLGGMFESHGGIPVVVNKEQKNYSAELRFSNKNRKTNKIKSKNRRIKSERA